MLEVCRALLRENPGVRFQTHLNENRAGDRGSARLFPVGARLSGGLRALRSGWAPHSVFAHNVHPTDAELDRLAAHGSCGRALPVQQRRAGQRHLPAAPPPGARRSLRARHRCRRRHRFRHVEGRPAGIPACSGSRPKAIRSSPAQLLYLATRAGAEALGLENETGDFTAGKSADLVYLRAAGGQLRSPPCCGTRRIPEQLLAAIFTLAGADSVREVRVGGDVRARVRRP